MTAYRIDLENSAERHFVASEQLYGNAQSKGVAGYLYGIAAECAIKALMRDSGIRSDNGNRQADPYYAHFPSLKTLLSNRIQGRHSQTLSRFMSGSFMREWDIVMRYAPENDIPQGRVDSWRRQAKQAIDAMRSK